MKKHWTQTPEGRARMREIALENDNLAKARLARVNSKEEKATALSVYGWEILLTDNEIKIRKQS